MAGLGINISFLIFIIGVIAFVFNGGKKGNLIINIIALELILLGVGLLLVHLSFNMDDLVGVNLTLYLLPLAGAESAVGLGLLVAYYPLRGTIIVK